MKSKIMKRVGLILACICMIGSLNGCAKFDASAYVKAILDNSYLNDSTEFVEQKIGTAEEAAELYKQGIDAEMDAMLASVTLSDEVQEAYREFYENMFQKVKYTVGEATKIDKNTIAVTVTYENMNIFTLKSANADSLILESIKISRPSRLIKCLCLSGNNTIIIVLYQKKHIFRKGTFSQKTAGDPCAVFS